MCSLCIHVYIFLCSCFLIAFSPQSYDIMNAYLIQIISTQLYGFKYSYLILIIIPLSLSSVAASKDFSDSLTISPYHLSLTAGLPEYILCPYRAVCCWLVLVGQPTLECLCEGVNWRTLMISFLLLLQCPA